MNESTKEMRLSGAESKEKRREYQRRFSSEYRKSHPKKDRREYFKKWEIKNADKRKAQGKIAAAKRYAENREASLARSAAYHLRNKDRIAARRKAEYIPRPRTKSKRTPESKLAYNLAYRAKNLERLKAAGVAYRAKTREARRARGAIRYASNREHLKAKARAYRAANKDKCAEAGARRYQARREYWIAKQKAYAKAHPEIEQNKAHVRKARKLGATISDLRAIKAWLKSWKKKRRVRCYWCGGMFSPKVCHQDHIEPLAGLGAHSISNLCVSCGPCNLKKHDKPLDKWNARLSEPVLL